jgi:hypothetical protein
MVRLEPIRWNLLEDISGGIGSGIGHSGRHNSGLVASHSHKSALLTLIHVFLIKVEPGAAAVRP